MNRVDGVRAAFVDGVRARFGHGFFNFLPAFFDAFCAAAPR